MILDLSWNCFGLDSKTTFHYWIFTIWSMSKFLGLVQKYFGSVERHIISLYSFNPWYYDRRKKFKLSQVAFSDIWRFRNLNFNHIYQHNGYINGRLSPAMDSNGQLATIFHLLNWKPAQKKPKRRLLNVILPQVGFFDFSVFKSRLWALIKKARPRSLIYGVKILPFHLVLSFG